VRLYILDLLLNSELIALSYRRDAESGSESEMSRKWSSRQRKTKSVGQDWYDSEMKANMQR